MKRTVSSLIVLLALVTVASARAAEGPAMTATRQLDLAALHMAATAQEQAKAGALSPQAAETVEGFAALVRDFRFQLEADFASSIQAQVAWSEVIDGFVATRDLLHDNDSRALRHELLRVHALMNRLDRGFGGSGFWSGPRGWNG